MHEIKCPHCQKAFKIDEAGYADIAKQVRDTEFERLMRERLEFAEQEKRTAVELAEAKLAQSLHASAAAKEAEIQALQAQLDAYGIEKKLELTESLAAVEKQRDALRNDLERATLEKELAEKSLKERYEIQLKDRNDEIERLRDMKARLSTKMVGETLEQHC